MSQVPKLPFDATRGPIRFMPGSFEATQAPGSPALTYEPYYGLKEKPFSLSADPRFLYRSPAHAPAFEELLTGIRRREGLIVLTGEIGTGKTTLIRSVLQHLDRRTFTAFVPDPFVSREDLLKMLLVDFGVVSIADLKRGSLAGASRPDLSYPLYEFLDSLVPLQAFAVLIIDEAQNLPLPLLEEIRILSDLEQREKLLQVVLVGQPELRSHMKLPEMRQVDQRVSVRCELSPLALEDVAEYVRHRLAVAGGGESRVSFSEAAIAAVFSASGGVPRVINLICDRALQRAHAVHASLVESSHVAQAIDVLGLDVPTGIAPAARTASPADGHAPEPEAVRQVEAPLVRPSSVPVRPAETQLSPQLLSDFAAETDLPAAATPSLKLWRFAASLLTAALAAAAIAALWYVYFVAQAVEVDAAALPPAPAWTRPGGVPTPQRSLDAAAPAAAAPTATQTQAPAPGPGPYEIQVATFSTRERAERLLNDLVVSGYRARIVEIDLGPARGLLLQIRVDGYQTIEDADRDLVRIREIPGYGDAHLLSN